MVEANACESKPENERYICPRIMSSIPENAADIQKTGHASALSVFTTQAVTSGQKKRAECSLPSFMCLRGHNVSFCMIGKDWIMSGNVQVTYCIWGSKMGLMPV